MEALEHEVKALHVALEQVQTTLTSPELARQSLKEQLSQRQVKTAHWMIQKITVAAYFYYNFVLLTVVNIVNIPGFFSVCWQI